MASHYIFCHFKWCFHHCCWWWCCCFFLTHLCMLGVRVLHQWKDKKIQKNFIEMTKQKVLEITGRPAVKQPNDRSVPRMQIWKRCEFLFQKKKKSFCSFPVFFRPRCSLVHMCSVRIFSTRLAIKFALISFYCLLFKYGKQILREYVGVLYKKLHT